MKEAEGLKKRAIEIVETLAGLREKHREAAEIVTRERDYAEMVRRKRMIALAHLPEVSQAADPFAGEPTREWSRFLLEHALEQDLEFGKARASVYDKERDMAELEDEIVSLAEELESLRAIMRMYAAIFGVFHGEGIKN